MNTIQYPVRIFCKFLVCFIILTFPKERKVICNVKKEDVWSIYFRGRKQNAEN